MAKILIIITFSFNATFAFASRQDILDVNCNDAPSVSMGRSFNNFCQVIISSDICKEVPKEDLLNCNYIRNPKDNNTWDFIKGCAVGVFESVKDILSFVWDVMKWVWGNATSSEARSSTGEQASAIMNSTKLYLHTEYQKAYSRSSSPFKSTKAIGRMGGKIAGLLINKITEYAKQQYQQLDCLNDEAKAEYICGTISDVFIPPAGMLALLKMGTKAASKFPNLKKLFEKKSPRTVASEKSFAQLSKKFPELKNVQNSIDLNFNKYLELNKIKNPKDIPFDYSNGFRPTGSKQMVQRAQELSPEMKSSITVAYNSLNDKDQLVSYFKELHMEAANWMAKKGRAADLEMLKKGEISHHAIGIVVMKRLKEHGDNKFTTILSPDDKTGRTLSFGKNSSKITDADLETQNRAFRAAIRTGPFFDRAFDESSKYGHGVFTHMIQRDIVAGAITKNKGKPSELWDYLGTPKGVNWWADLFDSGNNGSFTRPETVMRFMSESLKAK